jgi:glycogen debranching enzyme
MAEDGLMSAGEYGVQLTWMDAKVGDWVVTPRHGKPVEINALWYNALAIMDRFAARFGDRSEDYAGMAAQTRHSFHEAFWNHEQQCLYDLVQADGQAGEKDGAIRPNQIFAVSLPFSPLDRREQTQVVNTVWRELYFSYGLRSLSPHAYEYRGSYAGDVVQRDAAYHQGTGWGWLIGPFVTAFCRIGEGSEQSKKTAERFLMPFQAHLRRHGVGSISEIFDGDPPHQPRGCFSQAWSVAEVLRAYVEDIMGITPEMGIRPEKN